MDNRIMLSIKSTKNWWVVPLVYKGIIKEAKVKFRTGRELNLTKDSLGKYAILAGYYGLPDGIKEKYKLVEKEDMVSAIIGDKKVKLRMNVVPQIIGELSNRSQELDVKGKEVIDVGAYVGDTPLFYIIEGKAKHVYAYEPFPYLYNLAKESVAAFGFGKKITLFQEAVGKEGWVTLNKEETNFTLVSSEKESRNNSIKNRHIKVVTLDSIIDKHKIRHGALKVDCEGGEYLIFDLVKPETLAKLDCIHIEYHYGPQRLVEILRKAGFIVSCSEPKRAKGGRSMGDIFAKRR